MTYIGVLVEDIFRLVQILDASKGDGVYSGLRAQGECRARLGNMQFGGFHMIIGRLSKGQCKATNQLRQQAESASRIPTMTLHVRS